MSLRTRHHRHHQCEHHSIYAGRCLECGTRNIEWIPGWLATTYTTRGRNA
jgi:hypothetical protein